MDDRTLKIMRNCFWTLMASIFLWLIIAVGSVCIWGCSPYKSNRECLIIKPKGN